MYGFTFSQSPKEEFSLSERHSREREARVGDPGKACPAIDIS